MRACTITIIAICCWPAYRALAGEHAAVDAGGEAALVRELLAAPRPLLRRAPTPRASSAYLSCNDEPEGDGPRQLAFLADGSAVVIAHQDTGTLTFVDAATRVVTDTITVGAYPVDVAVAPDNSLVVAANALSHDVSLIDVATRTLVATLPVSGLQPFRVAITPDSRYAVVALINDAINSAFSIIDLQSHSEVQTIATPGQGVIGFYFTPESGINGALFTQFALTPDGARIVLPDRAGNRVKIYDRASGAELASLATAVGPTAIEVSADSSLAVVTHEGATRKITKIDLLTLTVSGTVTPAADLSDQIVRLTPDKSHALAAISNNVIFVDLASGVTSATLSTGVVGDIELSYDGKYAFVSNFNARVIDVAARTIVATMSFAACADSAVSPVDYRAAALNNRFREDVQFYGINGAAGALQGFTLTGAPSEGDATRDLAISADGRIAIACNNTSRNIAIYDLDSQSVRAYVDVGERPLDVAITPDGTHAVVCAADASFVRIVDLATDAVVASLAINTRPARVRISPDSQTAYVLNVATSDMITFIHLAGAASSILSSVSAGETGSALGYSYSEFSGIELSPSGAVLAVCDSFNDRLRLYDTTTRALLASVIVGDFPIRVGFNPAGTRAYVANSFSDNVSVVNVAGAGSSVIATVGGIDFPLTINVDASGAFVYVGNAGTSAGIRAIDAATNTVVATLPFPNLGSPRDAALSPTDGTLYAISTASELVRVSTLGAASAIVGTDPLSGSPSDMVFQNRLGRVVAAQPTPDGIDLLQFGCEGDLNGDRAVTLSDLGELLSNYGCTSNCAGGDADNDGDVDLSDLGIVLSAFGLPCDG